MRCFSARCSLLTVISFSLGITLFRQITDFLGYQWLCIFANFVCVIALVFAFFGALQQRSRLLCIYIVFAPIWIAWNIFLILYYLNIGIHRDSFIVSFGMRESVNFWVDKTGCDSFYNLTTHVVSYQNCLFDYGYVEAGISVIHAGVTLLSALLCIIVAVQLGRYEEKYKYGSVGGATRVKVELSETSFAESYHQPPSGGIVYAPAGYQAEHLKHGYYSDTTGYLNSSPKLEPSASDKNLELPVRQNVKRRSGKKQARATAQSQRDSALFLTSTEDLLNASAGAGAIAPNASGPILRGPRTRSLEYTRRKAEQRSAGGSARMKDGRARRRANSAERRGAPASEYASTTLETRISTPLENPNLVYGVGAERVTSPVFSMTRPDSETNIPATAAIPTRFKHVPTPGVSRMSNASSTEDTYGVSTVPDPYARPTTQSRPSSSGGSTNGSVPVTPKKVSIPQVPQAQSADTAAPQPAQSAALSKYTRRMQTANQQRSRPVSNTASVSSNVTSLVSFNVKGDGTLIRYNDHIERPSGPPPPVPPHGTNAVQDARVTAYQNQSYESSPPSLPAHRIYQLPKPAHNNVVVTSQQHSSDAAQLV